MDRLILTGILLVMLALIWISGNERTIKGTAEEALTKAGGAQSVAEAVGVKLNQLRIDHDKAVKDLTEQYDRVQSASNSHTAAINKFSGLVDHIDKKAEAAKQLVAFLEMKLKAQADKPMRVIVEQGQDSWRYVRADLKKTTSHIDPQHQAIINNVKQKLNEAKPALEGVSK